MDYSNFIFIILILWIFGLGWYAWVCVKKIRELKKEFERVGKESAEMEKMGEGLDEYYKRLRERREKIKKQILEMFGEKEKVSRKEVVEKLEIPTTSAVRYFDELEREGRVKQVGKTGRSAHYTLAE